MMYMYLLIIYFRIAYGAPNKIYMIKYRLDHAKHKAKTIGLRNRLSSNKCNII